jgi:hypothetical protein
MEHFIPGKKISEVHGQAFQRTFPDIGPQVFFALYHPVTIFNNNNKVAEVKQINFIPSDRIHIVTTPTDNGNRVDITLSGDGVYYSGICTGTNKLLVSLDGASYYTESTLFYSNGFIEEKSYNDLTVKAGPADPSTDGTGKRASLVGSDALLGSNAYGGTGDPEDDAEVTDIESVDETVLLLVPDDDLESLLLIVIAWKLLFCNAIAYSGTKFSE